MDDSPGGSGVSDWLSPKAMLTKFMLQANFFFWIKPELLTMLCRALCLLCMKTGTFELYFRDSSWVSSCCLVMSLPMLQKMSDPFWLLSIKNGGDSGSGFVSSNRLPMAWLGRDRLDCWRLTLVFFTWSSVDLFLLVLFSPVLLLRLSDFRPGLLSPPMASMVMDSMHCDWFAFF